MQDYIEIPLTQGRTSKIDRSDLNAVAHYNWCSSSHTGKKYAVSRIDGKVRYLHRFLFGFPARVHVDHINGDTLDNRRENLRLCSHSQNLRNRGKTIANKSGFKGVSMSNDKRKRKWSAEIRANGRRLRLGRFLTAAEAAMAYNEAAKIVHGSFAQLNRIP
jgi:hypothetical protein